MPTQNFLRAVFRRPALAAACLLALLAGAASATDLYARFRSDNDAAMGRMMSGMAIRSSGNVDRDFATIMIAHHQGAIDMAQAELRYGANEQLRRIAQEIIVDQQQEIAAMRLAIGDPPPPSAPSPTRPAASASPPPSPSITPEPH